MGRYKVTIEWEGIFETDDEDDLPTLAKDLLSLAVPSESYTIENFEFGSVDVTWEECD